MHNFTKMFMCVCLCGNEITIGTEKKKGGDEPSRCFFYTSSIFEMVFDWESLPFLPWFSLGNASFADCSACSALFQNRILEYAELEGSIRITGAKKFCLEVFAVVHSD